MSPLSYVVSEGMKRACADFSEIAAIHGFRPTKNRTWVRTQELLTERIYFHRHGSSYGAPRTASVHIRVMLSIQVLDSLIPGSSIGIVSDQARRATGYAYHHRFNAQTGSTYDRCLEELGLYLIEVAEPWFAEWADPKRLVSHADLSSEARESLALAMSP